MKTIREIISELKSVFNIEFAESESKAFNKFRDWVRRGIIEGPVYKVKDYETGGRQGLYNDQTLIDLAVIYFLHNKYRIPLDELGKVRIHAQVYEEPNILKRIEYKLKDDFSSVGILKGNYLEDIFRLWIFYKLKAKNGIDFRKPIKANIEIKFNEEKAYYYLNEEFQESDHDDFIFYNQEWDEPL